MAGVTRADANPLYHFGGFVLNAHRGLLCRRGEEVPLRPKTYEVLKVLVENAGRLMSKREMLDSVWGDVIVTDHSLTQCLMEARQALEDHDQRLIRTVRGRGCVFEAEVTTTLPPVDGPTPLRPRPALWAGAALALVGMAAIVGWVAPTPSESESISTRSIAVLPFDDLSGGADNQYIADGITEDLLNLLAQVPDLKVIARTSTFAYRDQRPPASAIGEQLDVAWLLEGSIRRYGDHVRIVAQLIEAESEAYLWSESLDVPTNALRQAQVDIAEAVAGRLGGRLPDWATQEVADVDPRAHHEFIQGLFFFNRRHPGDAERAEQHYRKAIAFDPSYGESWASLVGVYRHRMYAGSLDRADALELMGEAVRQGLKLMPHSPLAQIRAATYHWHAGEWERAGRHYRRAVELGANSSLVASVVAGEHFRAGEFAESIRWQRKAVELDPLALTNRANLGGFLLADGQLTEAEAELMAARELSGAPYRYINGGLAKIAILQHRPDDALVWIVGLAQGEPDRDLITALARDQLGMLDADDAALRRLQSGVTYDALVRRAEFEAYRQRYDRSFTLLHTALTRSATDPLALNRLPQLLWASPFLAPMRTDPRWSHLHREAREQARTAFTAAAKAAKADEHRLAARPR